VLTGAPIVSGRASIHRPFWDGLDLAVGVVRRIPADRCGQSLSELLETHSRITKDDTGHLSLLRKSGETDRPVLRVGRTDYLTLEASIDDSRFDRQVQQGFSGSFLSLNNRPVGMAVEKLDEQTIRFIRIEEIAMNIGRWLNSKGQSLPTRVTQSSIESPRNLKVSVIAVSNAATANESLPENMLSSNGRYEFEPHLPATITLAIETADASLKRVVITSKASDGYAMPKQVSVFTDSRHKGQASWNKFASGIMDRDGKFDSGQLTERFARRVQIVIRSTWSAGNVQIDQIRLE